MDSTFQGAQGGSQSNTVDPERAVGGSRRLFAGYRRLVFEQRPGSSKSKSKAGALATLAVILGLTSLFCVAYWAPLTGRAQAVWDADTLYSSSWIFAADHAMNGRVVLWNPWTNGGVPDYSDPNNGALSPLVVGMGSLTGGTEPAFRWYWLLSWLGGGLGMAILAKHLGAPAWGAFVVASGFLFSGMFTGHAEHTSIVHAFAFLPWIVWRWDVALRLAKLRPACEAGALLGVSALAGYPSVVLMNGTVALLWLVGRLLFPRVDQEPETETEPEGQAPGRPWAGVPKLLVLGITALVILCPTYLTFVIEGKGYSDRSGALPKEVAVASNALNPSSIATLASPFSPMVRLLDPQMDSFPGTDISSISLYTGAIVAWLALSALLIRPGSGWRWWLLGLGVLSYAIAVGPALPVRGWLYDYLPPMRYFRHSSTFRGYTIFALAVLATLACRDLARVEIRRWTRFAPLLAGLIAAAVAWTVQRAVLGRWDAEATGPDRPLADAHLLICWGGVVLAALLAVWRPKVSGIALLPILLVGLSTFDSLANAQLSRHTTYHTDPTTLAQWEELASGHVEDLDLTPQGLNRFVIGPHLGAPHHNKNLVTKHPALQNYSPYRNRFHLAWCGQPTMVAAATGADRIWFAPAAGVEDVHLSDATFDAFHRRTEELGAIPVVIHRREAMLGPVPPGKPGPHDVRESSRIVGLPPAQRIPVALGRYRPNILAFRVNIPETGYLLVTDRWARVWGATVDGEPAEVLGGNFIFRALRLEPGEHEVIMTYDPAWYPNLIYLSWGTFGFIAAWSLLANVRRFRTRGGEAAPGGLVASADA
ncbi:hypothetical protein BH23PLA1_BH23PLA1_12140 [soil metagenome]